MGLDRQQIGIFRHGKSTYNQRVTSIAEAFDLFPEGIETIERNVVEFSKSLSKKTPVAIYSSPYGRTIHSARLAMAQLGCRGFNLDSMKLDKDLAEVHAFDWRLFSPLVKGGELDYEGQTLKFDAAKTNPEGLSFQQYLMRDKAQDVAQEFRWEFPESYFRAISGIERFSNIRDRMEGFLRKSTAENPDKNIMAFTHEALVYDMLDKFTEGQSQSLHPGNYVHLERKRDGFYVKRAGDLKEGNSEVDILE
jgi:broad specificity phosphatase PhoE